MLAKMITAMKQEFKKYKLTSKLEQEAYIIKAQAVHDNFIVTFDAMLEHNNFTDEDKELAVELIRDVIQVGSFLTHAKNATEALPVVYSIVLMVLQAGVDADFFTTENLFTKINIKYAKDEDNEELLKFLRGYCKYFSRDIDEGVEDEQLSEGG
jgi:hypothetical protein